jgi:hypothetical protein
VSHRSPSPARAPRRQRHFLNGAGTAWRRRLLDASGSADEALECRKLAYLPSEDALAWPLLVKPFPAGVLEAEIQRAGGPGCPRGLRGVCSLGSLNASPPANPLGHSGRRTFAAWTPPRSDHRPLVLAGDDERPRRLLLATLRDHYRALVAVDGEKGWVCWKLPQSGCCGRNGELPGPAFKKPCHGLCWTPATRCSRPSVARGPRIRRGTPIMPAAARS